MALVTKIGTVTLPSIKDGGYARTPVDIMVQRRMANGTLRTTVIAQKAAWTLQWNDLTSAEVSTLEAYYQAGTALSFTPPGGGTADATTVHVRKDSWKCDPTTVAAGERFEVEFVLEEE